MIKKMCFTIILTVDYCNNLGINPEIILDIFQYLIIEHRKLGPWRYGSDVHNSAGHGNRQ